MEGSGAWAKMRQGWSQALNAVKSAGLVEPQALGEQVRYIIHPAWPRPGWRRLTRSSGRQLTRRWPPFWRAVFDAAGERRGEEKGQMVITAGLRSAPYLMRQKRWSEASALLEQAINRDRSPETIASVLPLLRHIAQATRGTDREL